MVQCYKDVDHLMAIYWRYVYSFITLPLKSPSIQSTVYLTIF
jgi:hypothetical protein